MREFFKERDLIKYNKPICNYFSIRDVVLAFHDDCPSHYHELIDKLEDELINNITDFIGGECVFCNYMTEIKNANERERVVHNMRIHIANMILNKF